MAWLLAAAGLFLVLFGVLAGVAAHGDVVERGKPAEREHVQVEAVLLTDRPLDGVSPGVPASRPARYVDAAGRENDVVLTLRGHAPAGTSVRAWVDRDGRVVAAPQSRLDSIVIGVLAAGGIIAVGGLVLEGMWLGVRRWLLQRNAAAWAMEWAAVEPEWSCRRR